MPSAKRPGALRCRRTFAEYGIEASSIPAQAGRQPFGVEVAEALNEFKPAVVSFQFGSAVV